jgi:hypothetical protein
VPRTITATARERLRRRLIASSPRKVFGAVAFAANQRVKWS